MIRLCRRPSGGPNYLKALSLVAVVGVASAPPKHTVAAARPIYGVSRHDEEGYPTFTRTCPVGRKENLIRIKERFPPNCEAI